MHSIIVSPELSQKVKGLCLSCIETDVVVTEKNEQLWKMMKDKIASLSASLHIDDISRLPAIASSRQAYRACGKDPARYRLSAESLLRRVVNRGELYQVNNVVDLLNLVSVSSGFSIGGYDADRIQGDIIFGIGKENEPYVGIGRGELNIEGMPVFRDNLGAFGTPTSDSVRTSVQQETSRFLMIIIDYSGSQALEDATRFALSLLGQFAGATSIQTKIIKA